MEPILRQHYADEIESWRAQMDESIRAENSWLALAGLLWLKQGKQYLQRSSNGGFLLTQKKVPGWISSFKRLDNKVFINPNKELELMVNGEPAHEQPLSSDVDSEPDFIEYDQLRMVVIRRGERVGLRIWDNRRSERQKHPQRSWYPLNPDYHLKAKRLSVEPDYAVSIPDVLGDSSEEKVIGALEFDIAGETMRLQALEAGEGQGLIIFADETNGRTTYPGGRFVVVDFRQASELTLDFNKAYNPPCAFTPHATCPLPPESNRLSVEIPAGERYTNNQEGH
ncbi:MAG: DUF1684 domain-containing protein [Anaerolineales bacterium]|jgi:hypothetical protein